MWTATSLCSSTVHTGTVARDCAPHRREHNRPEHAQIAVQPDDRSTATPDPCPDGAIDVS